MEIPEIELMDEHRSVPHFIDTFIEDYDTKDRGGHIFKPALQDISLKRFRMRYSTFDDCYYLHWDNAVCAPLSRIQGLENGTYRVNGIERVKYNDMSFITCETYQDSQENSKQKNNKLITDNHIRLSLPPTISWKIDFSQSGLAIKSIKIKARTSSNDTDSNEVKFQVVGDQDFREDIRLGDYFHELPALRGRKVVTLTATFSQNTTKSDSLQQLFTNYSDDNDCPLDIIVNLMCPQPHNSPLTGEILLGIKYSDHGASESLKEKSDITVDCGLMAGQLQVHLVEGAGIVKEGSKKTLNSFLKCSLLPDSTNNTTRQTSPRHSAYPTWTKEFIYAGIDSFDLTQSGLEVLLCDKHSVFTGSTIIGGVRLSIPQKRNDENFMRKRLSNSMGNLGCVMSPPTSRCSSPGLGNRPRSSNSSVGTPTLQLDLVNDILEQNSFCSLTDIEVPVTLPNGRPASYTPSSHHSALIPSPLDSPSMVRRVPVFTLPRNRDHPVLMSPLASPIPTRKQVNKSPKHSSSPKNRSKQQQKTEYLYDWMDSTGNEISHWQNVLDNPNEWVYCWHLLRPKITPSNEL